MPTTKLFELREAGRLNREQEQLGRRHTHHQQAREPLAGHDERDKLLERPDLLGSLAIFCKGAGRRSAAGERVLTSLPRRLGVWVAGTLDCMHRKTGHQPAAGLRRPYLRRFAPRRRTRLSPPWLVVVSPPAARRRPPPPSKTNPGLGGALAPSGAPDRPER